jgi:signal transduction histidine kinase
MNSEIWLLFPYPTLQHGVWQDGSLLDVHDDCRQCPTRQCEADSSAPTGEARQCRFGMSYARIDSHRLVAGVVARDLDYPTKRTRRRLRSEVDRRVNRADVAQAISRAIQLGPGVVDDYERAKQEVLRQLERDPEMHRALAEDLRKEFSRTLDQSHDYIQLIKLVRGHAEALLKQKYPDLDPDDAAERLPIEGAIYFSTELLLTKIDSLRFLNEINQVFGDEQRFRIHPFILKYVRIYNWQAEQKELRILVTGQCHASIFYNSEAIGAVIQALLDNLVKYAPPGSEASIDFLQTGDTVEVRFASLGPQILPEERPQIFLPGYRARAAREVDTSGLGIGLATAKKIADTLCFRLEVEQDSTAHPKYSNRYLTTFFLSLRE